MGVSDEKVFDGSLADRSIEGIGSSCGVDEDRRLAAGLAVRRRVRRLE